MYHPPVHYVTTIPLVGMLDVQKMHSEGEMTQVSAMSAAEFVDAFWFGRWEKFDENEKENRRQVRMVEFFLQNEYAGRIQAFVRGQRDRARVEVLRKKKKAEEARAAAVRQAELNAKMVGQKNTNDTAEKVGKVKKVETVETVEKVKRPNAKGTWRKAKVVSNASGIDNIYKATAKAGSTKKREGQALKKRHLVMLMTMGGK